MSTSFIIIRGVLSTMQFVILECCYCLVDKTIAIKVTMTNMCTKKNCMVALYSILLLLCTQKQYHQMQVLYFAMSQTNHEIFTSPIGSLSHSLSISFLYVIVETWRGVCVCVKEISL